MELAKAALIAAGLIGGIVALVHGAVVQRVMAKPIENSLAGTRTSASVRRLVPILLQFSTFNWLIGGIALIVAGLSLGRDARLATALLVGSSYAFAALGNFWGTRGRHPGWALYAVAVGLIAFAVLTLI